MTDTQLDRLYYTVDAELAPYKAKMADVESQAQKTGSAINTHLGKAGEGAERIGRGIEVSRRELLYFGRELATGDIRRLPSTFVLIASHLAGITSEAILMGGAVIGPFAALATAAFQAEKAQERVRLAIAATGGAAGMTAGQIATMANRLGNDPTSGVSSRGALDIASTLSGPGGALMGTGGNMQDIATRGTVGYSKMTGLSLDKSADEINKMMENPAKAAQDLHEKFNLLTDAQTLAIMATKDKAAQETEIYKALKDRGDAAAKSMWSLSQGADWLTTKLATLWNHTGDIVSHAETPGEKIARINKQLGFGILGGAGTAGGRHPYTPAQITKMKQDLMDATRQQAMAGMTVQEGDWQAAYTKRKNDAVSPGAMEIRKYRDEAAAYRLPQNQREMALAQSEARRQFDVNRRSDSMAPYAAGIQSAEVGEAQAKQNTDRKDALELVNRTADGAERLAAATAQGAVAAEHTTNANKAMAEAVKGSIDPKKVDDYTAALDRQSAAERVITQEKQNQKSTGDVAALQLEVSLLGQDEAMRNRMVAVLKAENDLRERGIELTSSEGQAAIALAKEQIDLENQKTVILRDQQKEMSVANTNIDLLGSLIKNPKGGIKTITDSIKSQTVDYGIVNPLKNTVSQMLTGKPGDGATFGDVSKTAGILFGHRDPGHLAAASRVLGGGPKRGESSDLPMFVTIVDGGGSSGNAAGGGISDMLSAFIGKHIAAATPHIVSGSVDAVSQAMARGFQFGGIGP